MKRAGGTGGSGSIEPEEPPAKPLPRKVVKKRPAKKVCLELAIAVS